MTPMELREYKCPNCGVMNRLRPKCSKCDTALIDPAFIRMSWWIYNRRKDRWLIFAAAAVVIVTACLLVLWAPFSATYEECRADAARSGKTIPAMNVLLDLCNKKFPKGPPKR
jgi:hypothetical protein